MLYFSHWHKSSRAYQVRWKRKFRGPVAGYSQTFGLTGPWVMISFLFCSVTFSHAGSRNDIINIYKHINIKNDIKILKHSNQTSSWYDVIWASSWLSSQWSHP